MRASRYIFIVLLVILLNACEAGLSSTNPDIYSVHPKLSQQYDEIGGLSTLGPTISESITKPDGKIQQYFQAGVLEYDPEQHKTKLVPIGLEFVSRENPNTQASAANGRIVDGYVIPNEFLALYDRIGPENVGQPLTNLHINTEYERYEQYFENLGFFITKKDPSKVHLLPYGNWYKSNQGLTPEPPMAIPDSKYVSRAAFVMQTIADRLGDDLTGGQLTAVFIDLNGNAVQLYNNVGMAVIPDSPAQVQWLLLPQLLDIQPTSLVARRDGPFYFWMPEGNQDGKGHNVPNLFWDFIIKNGGLVVSGAPITEIFYPSNDVSLIRQCFEHLCMDYDRKAPKSIQIHPAPLGFQYYQLYLAISPSPTQESSATSTAELVLQAWETYPRITSKQSQEISFYITKNGVPMADVQLTLEVQMPDGSFMTYLIPPSDSNGQTAQVLRPIDAPNNTIIPYKVCVAHNSTHFCIEETFWIMDNP
jgi:hypothetical protein